MTQKVKIRKRTRNAIQILVCMTNGAIFMHRMMGELKRAKESGIRAEKGAVVIAPANITLQRKTLGIYVFAELIVNEELT